MNAYKVGQAVELDSGARGTILEVYRASEKGAQRDMGFYLFRNGINGTTFTVGHTEIVRATTQPATEGTHTPAGVKAPRRTRADCTVRALANAAGIAYELAESIADDAGRSAGRGFNSAKLVEQAKKAGFSFRKIRMGTRTLRRFLREHPTGRYYARRRGHAFAILDGQVLGESRMGCLVLDAWRLEQVAA